MEGCFEARLEALTIDPATVDRRAEIHEIEVNTHAVLDLLEECGMRATFFFTGSSVADLPELVREVHRRGHEVGSHNYFHWRVDKLSADTFERELGRAVRSLEDVLGAPVYGFRAPQFSISYQTLWATDVLQRLGFTYDSSMYPYALRRGVGAAAVDPWIHRLPNGLLEFPPTTIPVLNRRLPAGGGGYYRLYPVWLSQELIAAANRAGHPCMFYIHPYEVGPITPEIPGLSPLWRWRLFHNAANGASRLRRLLRSFHWQPAIHILQQQGLVSTAHGN